MSNELKHLVNTMSGNAEGPFTEPVGFGSERPDQYRNGACLAASLATHFE